MGETITLTWWHGLLMCAGGATILYMLIFAVIGIVVAISDKIDEWTGKKKERCDQWKGISINHFRNWSFEQSKNYDDRHGIAYNSEGSAFKWFFGKYSYKELWDMEDETYLISDMYTEEELLKVSK